MPQLNIRVPQELLDRIRSQASRERVTVSELVRRAFPEPSISNAAELLASHLVVDRELARRQFIRAIGGVPPQTDLTSLSLGPPPSKPGSRLDKSPGRKKK